MWWYTLSILLMLGGLTVGLLLLHHDGVMVGEERAYARMDRLRRAERRMSEGRNTIGSDRDSFYNYEERV